MTSANDGTIESVPTEIGNYRLVRLLSKGAFGAVYQGEHKTVSGRSVAIKLLLNQLLEDEGERSRFLLEAQTLVKLKRHAHVLPFIDFGEVDSGGVSYLYLVTELAAHGSLAERLKRHGKRPLPQE